MSRFRHWRRVLTSLKESHISLNFCAQAFVWYVHVPKHLIFLTGHDDLNHGKDIDHELCCDDEPQEPLDLLAGARELEQVGTEGDSSDGGTHDAGGLGDEMLFHSFEGLFFGEAFDLPS